MDIFIGKTYRHYKGNLYKVIAFAKHSETTEDMVVYQSLKTGEFWVRPLEMWNQKVDDKGTLRFTLVEDQADMITKEVREWLEKVQRGQYSYNDAMTEFARFSRFLTREEMKMIKSKIENVF